MSIIGLGIDLIKINRIKRLISIYKQKLAQRILTKNELINYKFYDNKTKFLAKRFAIKEAAVKALGIGIKNGITFNQFEIYHDCFGKPYLKLFKQAMFLAKKLGVNNIHITLTDEKNYACAVVIIEN